VADKNQMFDFSVLRELRKRQGLTIDQVSQKAEISPAVISKLERNQTKADLDTLFKLSRVFGINSADFLSIAESHLAHKQVETEYENNCFLFKRISYGNMRCSIGTAYSGSQVSTPEIHQNDYEVCWVTSGTVTISLPHEHHVLSAGESLQFDAILEHSYKAEADSTFIIVHITKGKRF
jgi:transcriptional regulator with XRE-family HTH domain